MTFLGRTSLRVRIILLGMILVVPLVLLLVVRSNREAQHAFALARDQASLLVENANGGYSDIILKAQTAIEVVAKTPAAAMADSEGCDRFLESIRSAYGWANTLFITDAKGNRRCGTGRAGPSPTVAERDWFKRAVATKAPVVSDYLIGMISHRPQITVARPILDDAGQVSGVAAMGIDLGAFNTQLATDARDLGASVTVVDREGTVVARYPDADRFIGQKFFDNVFIARIILERRGQAEADGIAGVRRFFAYQPFGNTSMTIAIGIAKQPIVDRINRQLDRDLAFLAALVLACIGLALIGARRLILKPLRELGDAATAIGKGDFEAARGISSGAPELRRMLVAIRDMAQLIARREQDLSARESQYRILAENTRDIIFLHDRAGRRFYVSPASRRMLGYEPDELAILPAEDFVHPDDAAAIAEKYAALSADAPEFTSTHRLRRRDGVYIWVEADIRLIPDGAEHGGQIIATTRDITGRIHAEQAASALRRLLSDAIEAMQDGIAVYDADDRLVLFNTAVRKHQVGELEIFVAGRTFEVILRTYWIGLRESGPELDAFLAEALERHRRGDGYPWEVQDRDGRWNLTRHFRTRDGGILTVSTDITALKKAEAEAVRAGTLVTDAVNAMQDSISLFDAQDRLVVTNAALRTRFAARPDVITIGRSYEDIVRGNWSETTGSDRAGFEAYVAEELDIHRRADGIGREVRARDGTWRLNRQFRTADGGILVVSTDITARREAEAQAARARELVVDAIEAMQDAVSLYDGEERLVLANKALLQRGVDFPELFVAGTKFEDLIRGFWSAQEIAVDPAGFEAFVGSRLEHFRRGDGTAFETRTLNGAWFVSRHFRTREGGTISLNTEITAAKLAAAEIEAARDVAESANKAKSAFLASMSHEIRTPMNGVLGFAELLQMDTGLSPAQRSHVRGIYDAGKSLLALINDILDLSKIEAGKLEVESVPMHPDAIVDGAVSILRSQFTAKAIDLRVERAPDVPDWIEGDPTRVRQILLNLMSNALKFTESGRVVVRAYRQAGPEGDRLRFEVADTGIGIPANRLHLLFEDFSQVDRSTTRRYGGTGLGLAICKRLAEAMNGEIGVVSEPGVGSTFWFTIALVEAAAPDALEQDGAVIGPASAHILVAEDLPMNQRVIEGYLKLAGHSVALANNGLEAVARLGTERFDLVFMDMEMPEMDGISATRAIRGGSGAMRDIPIIALTANALLEDAALCKAAGMDDFLSKPIDRAALYAAVAKWAGAREAAAISYPAAPAPPVLDGKIIDDLDAVFGTEQAAEFVELCRTSLAEMAPVFVRWDDSAAVARAAHNLVSIAGNIGCTELMQISQELSLAKDNAAAFDGMRDRMVSAMERARSALDSRFSV